MIFNHIGIFVSSLGIGRQHLAAMLPVLEYSDEIEDPGLKVRVQFLTDTSGIRYELVAPYGEGNPVSGVLASKKNILNHVAYTTEELDVAVDRLRVDGAIPFAVPKAAVAFGGARVIFLLTPLTFIIELIESNEGEAR